MLSERVAENRWYKSTVQELFLEVCQDRPEKVAIVFNDSQITYRELQDQVNKCAQALLSLGINKGDHVAVLPTPCPEFTAVYFATLQIGAVYNPLNLLWGLIEFTGILKRNDPKIIITVDKYAGRDYIQLLRDAIPDLKFAGDGVVSSASVPTLTKLVSMSRAKEKYDGILDLQEVIDSGRHYDVKDMQRRVKEGKCTDIQFICQTSGTTGLSKSALWNHRPPLATANFLVKHMVLNEQDTYMNLAPFYHNSGIAGKNLILALAGATLYLNEVFDPVKAVELIHKHKLTATFGFDAHWQALNMVLAKIPEYRITSIKKAMACVLTKTFDLIHDEMLKSRDAHIVNLYAQTENGPLVSITEPDCMNYEIKKFTHGRPLPGVEFVIKDIVTGEKVLPGQAGEICYRSPYTFQGYYKQEEETRKLYDAEGYLHSGDYGSFDNGYVTFLGRLGGVVKTGGENVSTVYVTTLLSELFGKEFDDVLTVGVPDEYWGTKIVSWVRMRPGKKLRPLKELRAECKGKMAEYEIPKEFLEWEGPWPVTPENKINFKTLQQEAEVRLTKK
jgi:fatty-acyl-CoA synthase